MLSDWYKKKCIILVVKITILSFVLRKTQLICTILAISMIDTVFLNNKKPLLIETWYL